MSFRQAIAGGRIGRSIGRRRRVHPSLAVYSREFHPTARKEVLPLIGGALAVAVVATGLRYLVRAGQRMREMEAAGKTGDGGGGQEGGNGNSGKPGGRGAPPPYSHTGGLPNGPAYGIDVGVSSLRLAYSNVAGKMPEVVENREGSRWTPAAIAFKEGSDPIVGQLAMAQRFEAPTTTLVGMQPLVGLPFDDHNSTRIATSAGAQGAGLVEGEGGMIGVSLGGGDAGRVLTGEGAVRVMLSNMQGLGEHKVGTGGGTVLTHPGHFNDQQKLAMYSAGEGAGLAVLDTVPDAVAVVTAARGLSLLPPVTASQGGLAAVFDMGGLSAQCSIVDIGEKGAIPKLVAADWSGETGGSQWEKAIVVLLDQEFGRANGGMSLLGDPLALTRLHDAAGAAKVELSRAGQASVNIPFITADMTGPKHLDVVLTGARVDRAVEEVLQKAEAPCLSALSMAGVGSPADLSCVILAGGCSRSPAFQALARRVFKGFPEALTVSEQSEELAVLGAAIEARRRMYES